MATKCTGLSTVLLNSERPQCSQCLVSTVLGAVSVPSRPVFCSVNTPCSDSFALCVPSCPFPCVPSLCVPPYPFPVFYPIISLCSVPSVPCVPSPLTAPPPALSRPPPFFPLSRSPPPFPALPHSHHSSLRAPSLTVLTAVPGQSGVFHTRRAVRTGNRPLYAGRRRLHRRVCGAPV